MLKLKPVSLREANEYVKQRHRHHKPVVGHKFSIGCEADGELVGVVIAGRLRSLASAPMAQRTLAAFSTLRQHEQRQQWAMTVSSHTHSTPKMAQA